MRFADVVRVRGIFLALFQVTIHVDYHTPTIGYGARSYMRDSSLKKSCAVKYVNARDILLNLDQVLLSHGVDNYSTSDGAHKTILIVRAL